MPFFEDVYRYYRADRFAAPKVEKARASAADAAIRDELPRHIAATLAQRGLNASLFKIYGGVGQLNFNRARVPWVAICKRTITTTTNREYYVVLLFKEDMTGAYLSLNQGYTQYKNAYGSTGIAKKFAIRTASVCLAYLNDTAGYETGPIDLAATNDMGKGYEQAAILSKHFDVQTAEDDPEFAEALVDLVQKYIALEGRIGADILSIVPPPAEPDFQAAVQELSRSEEGPDIPTGPLQPAAPGTGGHHGGRHKRDPEMAAEALRAANHKCEVDNQHTSFPSRKSGKMFVEAHHLIPISKQDFFRFSLDVPENIVSLCPNCHRNLHFGRPKDFRKELLRQHSSRAAGLKSRGIGVDADSLLGYYRSELSEDD